MKKTLAAITLFAVLPLAAHASESNGMGYTGVELDYLHTTAQDALDLQGGRVGGSYAIDDRFFLSGSASRMEGSTKTWTLGMGSNAAIGSRADWVSQLGYAHRETGHHRLACNGAMCSLPESHEHARGYSVSTGVRGRLTDQLTANAYLGYEDYEHQDGNWYADFDAGYNLTPMWSVETGVVLAESAQTWKLGVRANF